MNFDNFKPAWEQFKLQQNLNTIPAADILAIIENQPAKKSAFLFSRILQQAFMFGFLIFCCNGC